MMTLFLILLIGLVLGYVLARSRYSQSIDSAVERGRGLLGAGSPEGDPEVPSTEEPDSEE